VAGCQCLQTKSENKKQKSPTPSGGRPCKVVASVSIIRLSTTCTDMYCIIYTYLYANAVVSIFDGIVARFVFLSIFPRDSRRDHRTIYFSDNCALENTSTWPLTQSNLYVARRRVLYYIYPFRK